MQLDEFAEQELSGINENLENTSFDLSNLEKAIDSVLDYSLKLRLYGLQVIWL